MPRGIDCTTGLCVSQPFAKKVASALALLTLLGTKLAHTVQRKDYQRQA